MKKFVFVPAFINSVTGRDVGDNVYAFDKITTIELSDSDKIAAVKSIKISYRVNASIEGFIYDYDATQPETLDASELITAVEAQGFIKAGNVWINPDLISCARFPAGFVDNPAQYQDQPYHLAFDATGSAVWVNSNDGLVRSKILANTERVKIKF